MISLLGGLEDWIFFCTLARLGIAAGAPRGPACLLQLEHRAELAREVACSEAGIDAGKQYGHRCWQGCCYMDLILTCPCFSSELFHKI